MRHLPWRAGVLISLILATGLVIAQPTVLQLFDTFGVAGNKLDTTLWTTEIGPSSFLGRTQLRNWVNQSNIGPFVVMAGDAELALDTYNPTAGVPGDSFFGTHAKSLGTFVPTASMDYIVSARMRLTTLPRGLVFGVYLYGCDAGPCATSHDEIDIELVTNFLQGAPLRAQLNRYREEPLGAGTGPIVNLPAGFDPLAWHVWTIRWGLNRITYFVDGVVLFEATTVIAQHPMGVDLIAWAPGGGPNGWPDAYDPALQPAASPAQNQRFVTLVDYVSVRALRRESPSNGGSIDVNGDRIADVLMQGPQNWIGAFLLNGTGVPFQFVYIYPGNLGSWRVVGTADVNLDGIADILVQNSDSGWIGAFLMDGSGTPTQFIFIYPGGIGDWRVVGTADVNCDGIADVLLQNNVTRWIGAFLMDGSGVPTRFVDVYPGDTGNDWRVVATADLDGDGITDLVMQDTISGWIGAYLMGCGGTPVSFKFTYPGTLNGWRVAGAADLDGDGIRDLLLQSPAGWIGGFILDGHGVPASFIYVYPGDTGGWQVVGGR